MKIALFWPGREAGELLLKKFTDHGDFVYVYCDDPAALKFDSMNYEIQRGSRTDQAAMERAVSLSDVVVCMCDPQLMRGKRKDESTPFADGVACVLAVMKKFGKTRLFVTAPVAECEQKQGRTARAFAKVLRKFFPHTHRDVCKFYGELSASGIDYTVVRYMNPYLKHSKDGYVLADGADKSKTGVSMENLAQCLFDLVVADSHKGQMPIVYNRHQS